MKDTSEKMLIPLVTGWGNFDQLAERIYWFGANSSPSHIWPMYSAEDSLSPYDDNIYLGRWLQGTGTWTNQHYFTECQNIFRGQVHDYVDSILFINTTWQNSISINGDAFFKYGLNVLDSLRNQDRFPNFYTRQACYQYRFLNPNIHKESVDGSKKHFNNLTQVICNEIEFEKWKLDNKLLLGQIISLQGQQMGRIEKVSYSSLSSGFYYIVLGGKIQRIVINKQ